MQGYLSEMTARWLLLELARTTLLVAVLGAAAWLVLRLSRIKSPTLHRVCCVMVLLAGWTLVRWPVDVAWYEAPAPVVAEVVTAEPQPESFSPPIDPARLSPPPEFGAGMGAPVMTEPESAAVAEPLEAVQQPEPIVEPEPAWSFSWEQMPVAAWLFGIVAVVGWWLVGYVRFLWQLPRGLAGEPEWRAEFAAAMAEQGSTRAVEFRVTDDMGPLLCRLPRRTVLLVPHTMWSELESAERCAILRHELAHLSRGDLWKSLAVRVLALPHWFNPVAWLAVRRFDDAAEWACDQAAMASEPTSYAAMLLRLGELAGTRARFGSAMSNRPLTTRIRRLLTLGGTEDSAMKKACLMSLLVLVMPLVLVQVNLVAEEPEEKPKATSANGAELHPDLVQAVEALDRAAADANVQAPKAEQSPEDKPADDPVKAAQRKMVEHAKKTYEAQDAAYKSGTITLDQVFHWSNLWLNAELAIAESREEQIAAAQRNLARLKVIEANIRRLYESGSRGGEQNAMSAANYHVADAERRLAEIEAMPEKQVEAGRPAVNREMVDAAKQGFEATTAAYMAGQSTLEAVISWSNRWLAAELEIARSREEQLAAAEAHLGRIADLHTKVEALYRTGSSPRGSANAMATVNYYLADAKRRLAEIEGLPLKAPAAAANRAQPPQIAAAERQQLLDPGAPSIAPRATPAGSSPYSHITVPDTLGSAAPSAQPVRPDQPLKFVDPYAPSHAAVWTIGGKRVHLDRPDLLDVLRAAIRSGDVQQMRSAMMLVDFRLPREDGSDWRRTFPELAPELVPLLGHEDASVRESAERALLWIRVPARDELRKAAQSENSEIATRAKWILAQGPEGKAEALQLFTRSIGPVVVATEGENRAVPLQQPEVVTTRPQYYNGKTFEQWRTQLQTDLSPTLRKEAMYAMAEFASHGYGKEAAEVIFETANYYPATRTTNAFENEVQTAAIYAASRVPGADLLPLIARQLESDDVNERLFAIQVVPLDPPQPGVAELLEKAMDDSDPRVATEARAFLSRADWANAKLDKWIRESLAKGDESAIADATKLVLDNDWKTPLGREFYKQPYKEKLPEVIALLHHAEPRVRERTESALQNWRSHEWLYKALQEYVNRGGPDSQDVSELTGIPKSDQPIDRRK